MTGQTLTNQIVKKRSVLIAGHSTSVSLEQIFWDELELMAKNKGVSMNKLVTSIDKQRQGNLSSALRVMVLTEVKARK